MSRGGQDTGASANSIIPPPNGPAFSRRCPPAFFYQACDAARRGQRSAATRCWAAGCFRRGFGTAAGARWARPRSCAGAAERDVRELRSVTPVRRTTFASAVFALRVPAPAERLRLSNLAPTTTRRRRAPNRQPRLEPPNIGVQPRGHRRKVASYCSSRMA
jgi:hypothetical protein